MSDLAWRTWAEQMATGLALVDADLRLRWLNPALVEDLALGFRSAVGQPLGLLLEDADEGMAQAARVLAEQRPAHWRGVALSSICSPRLPRVGRTDRAGRAHAGRVSRPIPAGPSGRKLAVAATP